MQLTKLTFFIFSIVLLLTTTAVKATDYYSGGNSDATNNKSWFTNTDGTGNNPKDFNQSGDTFIIQSGHTMTTSKDWTVKGTLQISEGGKLINTKKITVPSILVNGTYQHDADGITMPAATWGTNSLCLITGVKGTQLTGDNQNFANLTYDCSGLTKDITLDAVSIAGDLNVLNTKDKNLIMNQSALTVGGNCTINGNLIIATDGNSRSLTVNGNFVFMSNGKVDMDQGGPKSETGTLIIKGDLDISAGKLLVSGDGKSAGLINFSGTSLQTFKTAGVSTTLKDIISYTINNPAGVTLAGNLTLLDNTGAVLTLTNGNLNTADGNILTLSNQSSVSGGSSSSFVDGPMQKMTNTTAAFTFPVGKGNTYLPIGITPATKDQSTFRAEYNNSPYVNTTSFSGGITRVSTIDYYQLSRTAGNANVFVTVYWNASSGVTAADMQSLKVAHWNGSLWENLGGKNITGNASYGNVTTTSAVGSFSPFALGSTGDSPLPVSLASLTSSTTGRNVNLKWTTISEINNSGFDVERKGFSGDYVKVGHMQGKGTVSTPSSYEFTDRNLASGKYSYRLKQIDNNGNFEYYSLNGDVVVGVPSKFDLSQNYPNPFNPSTKINFDMPKDGLVSLKIYDMLGREVSTLVSEFRTAGYYSVDFNASSLTSGVYFYRVSTGDFSAVKKMTVLK
jgi:hypothetical protein